MQDNTTPLNAENLNKFLAVGDYDAIEKRICYGGLSISNGAGELVNPVGFASVEKVATGSYRIYLSANMQSSVSYMVTASNSAGSGDLSPVVSEKTSSAFKVGIYKISAGALADDDTTVDLQVIGG